MPVRPRQLPANACEQCPGRQVDPVKTDSMTREQTGSFEVDRSAGWASGSARHGLSHGACVEQRFGLVADVDHLLGVLQLQPVEARAGNALGTQVDVFCHPAGRLGMLGFVGVEDLGAQGPELIRTQQFINVEDARS